MLWMVSLLPVCKDLSGKSVFLLFPNQFCLLRLLASKVDQCRSDSMEKNTHVFFYNIFFNSALKMHGIFICGLKAKAFFELARGIKALIIYGTPQQDGSSHDYEKR